MLSKVIGSICALAISGAAIASVTHDVLVETMMGAQASTALELYAVLGLSGPDELQLHTRLDDATQTFSYWTDPTAEFMGTSISVSVKGGFDVQSGNYSFEGTTTFGGSSTSTTQGVLSWVSDYSELTSNTVVEFNGEKYKLLGVEDVKWDANGAKSTALLDLSGLGKIGGTDKYVGDGKYEYQIGANLKLSGFTGDTVGAVTIKISPVPEPTTMTTLLIGLMVIATALRAKMPQGRRWARIPLIQFFLRSPVCSV